VAEHLLGKEKVPGSNPGVGSVNRPSAGTKTLLSLNQGVWIVLPGLGPIRISTVVAALALMGILSWRRNPALAVLALMAWASAYEIVFNGIGVMFFGWSMGPFVWGAAAVLGWLVLASVLGVYPDWRIAGLCAFVMLVWMALGFHSDTPTRTPFDVVAEILNELSKSLLALAYVVGNLGRGPSEKSLSAPTSMSEPFTTTAQAGEAAQQSGSL
jgi:hypothetical protein